MKRIKTNQQNIKNANDDSIRFNSYDAYIESVARIVADFCRDHEFEINDHPMDYEAHYHYIHDLFLESQEEYEV